MASSIDPICGHCGKRLSEHFKEDPEIYCYKDTNGDLFSDEPSGESIAELLSEKHPVIFRQLREEWKRLNGHKTNA